MSSQYRIICDRLENLKTIRDIGMMFSDTLTFNYHIENLKEKET